MNFSRFNRWAAEHSNREGLLLERIACDESEGKYQLGLYFNQPIYAVQNPQPVENDTLQVLYDTAFYALSGQSGVHPDVEVALNGDRTAMGIRGPKSAVLEVARTAFNVATGLHVAFEPDEIAALAPGQSVGSDEDIMVLKATGRAPAKQGKTV